MNKNTVNALAEIEILRITEGGKEPVIGVVNHEAQVSLRINEKLYRSFYCIPNHLEDMVRGHLISEGLSKFSDIKEIKIIGIGNDIFFEAIESAEKYGITLIGFAMQRRSNIYSHKERIIIND